MSTDVTTSDPTPQIAALHRQLDVLTDELGVAHLQTEVAAIVIPLIRASVDAVDDRLAVVADIVDCWRYLPEKACATYTTGHHRDPIANFALDYTEIVEEHLEPGPGYIPDPTTTDRDGDIRNYLWHQHIADIRHRAERYEPPPAAAGPLSDPRRPATVTDPIESLGFENRTRAHQQRRSAIPALLSR
jgi:hypothetical protein